MTVGILRLKHGDPKTSHCLELRKPWVGTVVVVWCEVNECQLPANVVCKVFEECMDKGLSAERVPNPVVKTTYQTWQKIHMEMTPEIKAHANGAFAKKWVFDLAGWGVRWT